MQVSELTQLLSLSMSYQAYLQELNAQNLQLANTGSSLGIEKSFAELIEGVDVAEVTNDEWRSRLVEATNPQPASISLDQLSLAATKNAGSYRVMAEGMDRLLSLYRTSLGKG